MLAYRSRAKINIHLHIQHKRLDGFHNIESIMAELQLSDILFFEISRNDEVIYEWHVPPMVINSEQNSILRALQVFKKATLFDGAVRVLVKKYIPLGSGLGGASSNAVATLQALNEVAGTHLSQNELALLAQQLGSDCNFFIRGGVAWATGRGDIIKPLSLNQHFSVVLVNPGFHSSTVEAFQLLDAYRTSYGFSSSMQQDLFTVLQRPPIEWRGTYINDFLPIFLEYGKTVYRSMLHYLSSADFSGLSGSGSTCFGIFSNSTHANRCASSLKEKWPLVLIDKI
ncbi:MAG: 4-(cytidine 5'-diphospho)-2-C-methyl-D-erythritol kinase [Treponema sp.]|jgi:4-diphosphocytidyl-2-C-methyl-D-erythritol kinase|nr:4-(cytidine 5'-diphospho)-2-C-methyl-D-erythritol kinase [Treponema sp.]